MTRQKIWKTFKRVCRWLWWTFYDAMNPDLFIREDTFNRDYARMTEEERAETMETIKTLIFMIQLARAQSENANSKSTDSDYLEAK